MGEDEQVTPDELLQVFHQQVRLTDKDVAPGWTFEQVGQVRRAYPEDRAVQAFVETPDEIGRAHV